LSRKTLLNKTVLITAGPTREYLDPVRYLTNSSSGRMGYALSKTSKEMGAKVLLVSGPTGLKPPEGVKTVFVKTALQMRNAVRKLSCKADIMIFSAAVCDYRPRRPLKEKIKSTKKFLEITLVKNPDIIKEAASGKGGRKIIGFALETGGLIKNAKKKLIDKKLDMIVANPAGNMEKPTGSAVIMLENGRTIKVPRTDKFKLSKIIMEAAAGLLK